MPADETKNDVAWRAVFTARPLLATIRREGFVRIASTDLRRLGGYPPRLMAKQDSSWNRPRVFKDHDLNILPVTRGEYVIFSDPLNSCYKPLPVPRAFARPVRHDSPISLSALHTLPQGVCSTESGAIDIAFITSLLQEFTGLRNLVLTKRGRFGSGNFDVGLPTGGPTIRVVNAQVEADSIFENEDAVVLIEAKIGFKKDFHIRQLRYPYEWIRAQTDKRVVPLLLCYSHGEFQLTEFEFGMPFSELRYVRQQLFVIDENPLAAVNVTAILRHAPTPRESTFPFPQANRFERVLDLVSVLEEGIPVERLADHYGFVPRQTGYYLNAAKYLGLVDGGNRPTATSKRLLRQDRARRIERILKLMIARPALRAAFDLLQAKHFSFRDLTSSEIMDIVRRLTPLDRASMIRRRASTVRSWMRWLCENCEFLT